MTRALATAALAALALAACGGKQHRAAREKYDHGVELLAKGDFAGAETALTEARADAGVDPELRFRAAYDLGLAYAAHAEQAKKPGKDGEPDLTQALELEQKAVSWFFDAAQLRKDDDDTKTNLAIARARLRAIEDELARSGNKLEARLDAVIKEQRGVLADARDAWAQVKQTHGADPLAQENALVHLADLERGILAEAGVIGDLASDEIDTIGKKPEDKRSQEEKVRIVQLKNLDLYLMDGRTAIAETRKKLQELDAENGVARAEAALVALKRAREQLLDPITVLREIAGDQRELAQQTGQAGAHEGGGSLLAKPAPADQPALPGWMAPPALAERQIGLHARVEEVKARLAAAQAAKDQAKDDKQKKLLERVAAALPHVDAASTAMDSAHGALVADKLADAAKAQRDALIELARAIEQFADLKQTIDLAAETQHQIVALLSPEAAKELSPADRTSQTADALAANLARMTRIQELIADEVAQVDQQAQAAAAKPDPKQDPKQAEQMKQQAEAMKQRLATAETLRADAAKALADTQKAIQANKDPTAPAKLAADKLDELRRLFFTVIEHLQELIRQQGETRDQTSQANGEDDFTRAPKLPGLVSHETEHADMAKAITDALAAQADAAAKQQGGQPLQPGAPSPKSLSAAADEVRLAQNDMADANVTLGKAKDAKQSVSLEPAIDSMGKALDHLENALEMLQPPSKKNKDQQQQQDQQQQAQQQQQQQPQQQGGAGQRVRDEDAQRQRDRRRRQAETEPVDEDW